MLCLGRTIHASNVVFKDLCSDIVFIYGFNAPVKELWPEWNGPTLGGPFVAFVLIVASYQMLLFCKSELTKKHKSNLFINKNIFIFK